MLLCVNSFSSWWLPASSSCNCSLNRIELPGPGTVSACPAPSPFSQPPHPSLPCPSGVACLFDTFVYFSYAFHIDFRAWASLRTSCLCIEFQTNRLARFGLCCACCVCTSVCVCECVPCHSLFPLLFRFHFHVPFSYFCVCFALHLINFYALFVFKYFSLNRYNIFSARPSTLSPSNPPLSYSFSIVAAAAVYVMR